MVTVCLQLMMMYAFAMYAHLNSGHGDWEGFAGWSLLTICAGISAITILSFRKD